MLAKAIHYTTENTSHQVTSHFPGLNETEYRNYLIMLHRKDNGIASAHVLLPILQPLVLLVTDVLTVLTFVNFFRIQQKAFCVKQGFG